MSNLIWRSGDKVSATEENYLGGWHYVNKAVYLRKHSKTLKNRRNQHLKGGFVEAMKFQTIRITRECGTCTVNCLVEVPDEFNMNLGFRKAIFVPFSQAVPVLCTIDEEHYPNHVQVIVGGRVTQ